MKNSAPKVAIKTSEISLLRNKNSEAVIAEQWKFVSQLLNSMCHKAKSQNGRFCTLITVALVIFGGYYKCHHAYVTEVEVNQQYDDKLLTLADIETLLNNTMAES